MRTGNRVSACAALAGFVLACACGAGTASARGTDVEAWVESDLSGYVAGRLANHPRFKGASVRFVVMRNGNPQARVDALSLRLRDRLQRRVVDTPGVTVAWRPDTPDRRVPRSGAECSAGDVQYLVGIELTGLDTATQRLSVRALDVVEKTWVSGFGTEWRGRLSWEQSRTAQRSVPDRAFLGNRDVPYSHGETDLMATHLARDLGCALMRQVAGEYVVASAAAGASGVPLPGLLSLVTNNVAGLSALRQVAEPAQANSTLNVQAFPVDGDLHQYWVTLTPVDAASGLQPVSTSVYVRLPGTKAGDRLTTADAGDRSNGPALDLGHDPATATIERDVVAIRPLDVPGTVDIGASRVLDAVRLVTLKAGRACARRDAEHNRRERDGTRPRGCAGLEVTTRQAAVVFVLSHEPNHGLLRLSDAACEYRTAAHIARPNVPLTIALPGSPRRDAWLRQDEWRLDPDADTYYAIAVSDSRAARSLASHLDRLPQRCAGALPAGYAGAELARWLSALADAVERWRPHVDWNAISVRNVY